MIARTAEALRAALARGFTHVLVNIGALDAPSTRRCSPACRADATGASSRASPCAPSRRPTARRPTRASWGPTPGTRAATSRVGSRTSTVPAMRDVGREPGRAARLESRRRLRAARAGGARASPPPARHGGVREPAAAPQGVGHALRRGRERRPPLPPGRRALAGPAGGEGRHLDARAARDAASAPAGDRGPHAGLARGRALHGDGARFELEASQFEVLDHRPIEAILGRSSPPAPPSTATSQPAGPEAAVRTAVILGTNFLVGAAALAWVLVRHGVPALELLASGPRLGLLALFRSWSRRASRPTRGAGRFCSRAWARGLASPLWSATAPRARASPRSSRVASWAASRCARCSSRAAASAVRRRSPPSPSTDARDGAAAAFACAYALVLLRRGVPALEGALVTVSLGAAALALGSRSPWGGSAAGPGW